MIIKKFGKLTLIDCYLFGWIITGLFLMASSLIGIFIVPKDIIIITKVLIFSFIFIIIGISLLILKWILENTKK